MRRNPTAGTRIVGLHFANPIYELVYSEVRPSRRVRQQTYRLRKWLCERTMIVTVVGDAPFDFFSSRLSLIDFTGDDLLDIQLHHHLSEFEDYVFGVVLQYNRIRSGLVSRKAGDFARVPGPQPKLDIYYYILTWDKLKKILKKIVSRLQEARPSIPKKFYQDFRAWKARVDHLFSAFDTNVRNEYEHPSLEPYVYSESSLLGWNSILIGDSGDIKVHAAKDCFFTIKHEHSVRIQALRIDLFDLFVKHFSQKSLTRDLVKTRAFIEENIDPIIKELEALKGRGETTGYDSLLHRILMHDMDLQREGVPLLASTREKLHSILIAE